MIVAIFSIMAFVLCQIVFLLLPKAADNRKFSLFRTIPVSIYIQICINFVIAFILSKLNIRINLPLVGVINMVIALFLAIYMFIHRDRGVQKYTVELIDIINIVTVLFILFVVIWRTFGFALEFNYCNSDSGEHLAYAMRTYRTGRLFDMPFAAFYNAIFIDTCTSLVPSLLFTKAFIIAETVSTLLNGLMFYVLMYELVKNTLMRKISFVFTALYFVGWPIYNYVQGGFVYWGIVNTLILLGLILAFLYKEEYISKKVFFGLVIVNILSISLCYILLAPYAIIMYAVIILQIDYKNIKDKKKFVLLSVCIGIVALIITVIGVGIYFKWDFSNAVYWLSNDGGIHRSLYKDIMYFIPFISVAIFNMKKQKQLDIPIVGLMTWFIMVVGSFVVELAGLMSSYYYYKLYYMLWALCWIVAVKGISLVIEKKETWAIGYMAVIGFLFVYSFSPLENMEQNSYGLNASKNSPEFPMYSAVGSYIKNKPETSIYNMDPEYFELVDFVVKTRKQMPIYGNAESARWYKKIINVSLSDEKNMSGQDFLSNIKSKPNIDSFCIEKSSDFYKQEKEMLENDYLILYENSYALVLGVK